MNSKIYATLIFLSLLVYGCTNSTSSLNDERNIINQKDSIENNAESIYEFAKDKVVLIMALKDGIPFSQGTGFFISEDTLVTNFHVIQGATSVNIKFCDKEDIIKRVKIAKASPNHDLALLVTKAHSTYLPIDSTGAERIGSKIYTIGNPRGLEGTISEGILSGRRINDDIQYLQITAPISPGNSGGPIINTKGEVIGVSTFTFKGSQNLNFGVPIGYITHCVDYNEIPANENAVVRKSEKGALQVTDYQKLGPEFSEHLSLKNNTEDVITSCEIVILYKKNNEVIDYQTLYFTEDIEPGLAKRFSFSSFDHNQDWEYIRERNILHGQYKHFDIEVRILSYTIEE